MHKNNILNNYNKDTELAPSFDSSSYNTEVEKNSKEKCSKELKKLSINFSEINFKKDIILYSTLIFFNFIAIIFGFLEKKFDVIISMMLVNYLTLFISTKSFKLENNRYVDVSMQNTCTSLNMFFKASFGNEELDYEGFIKSSVIVYLSSSLISMMPSCRYLIILSFSMLIYSFLLALCNKDGEIIKESLLVIKKYTPAILILSFMIGVNFYSVNALNFTGYMGWLILYKLCEALSDYSFDKI